MRGLPVDVGRSPVAARMAWLLETTAERSLTTEDLAAQFALPPLVDPSSMLDRITGPWPVENVGTYEELSPTFARLDVTGTDGHRRALRVGIDAAAPHRIRYASRFHAPAGVRVRDATEADAPALADLERRTPVIDTESERSYDRADWFGQLRLMDEVVAVVAEIDGRIVGVHADAIRTTRLAGHDYRMMYRFRTRVDPAFQGHHVFPALNGGAADRPAEGPAACAQSTMRRSMAVGQSRSVFCAVIARTRSLPVATWVSSESKPHPIEAPGKRRSAAPPLSAGKT